MECYRILKPTGILRVVVPNLENICTEYLKIQELAYNGDSYSENKYEWIILELLDQMVREKSGGEMLGFFNNHGFENKENLVNRCGYYVTSSIVEKANEKSGHKDSKLRTTLFFYVLAFLKNILNKNSPNYYSEKIIYKFFSYIIGKENLNHMMIGKFRNSGEIHKWMYDKYSLSRILKCLNFSKVHIMNAFISNINNWEYEYLDHDCNGNIYRSDSLYIEAIK